VHDVSYKERKKIAFSRTWIVIYFKVLYVWRSLTTRAENSKRKLRKAPDWSIIEAALQCCKCVTVVLQNIDKVSKKLYVDKPRTQSASSFFSVILHTNLLMGHLRCITTFILTTTWTECYTTWPVCVNKTITWRKRSLLFRHCAVRTSN
jgi:hypothetical protein